MANEKKSLGQTAYEKFTKATTPENTPAMTWGDLNALTRGAWEEASEAALFAFVDTKRMPDGTSTPAADLSRLHAAASWRAEHLRPSQPEREDDGAKAMGQIAYEAFHGAYAPSIKARPWEDSPDLRAAWEAAAAAVLAQPHRGTVHGPCEMRGYDFITLAVPHRLEYPVDALGFPTRLPAGTRLHILEPKPGALGVSWETGSANPAGMGPHFDSPEAHARMADLIAKARATRESEP